VAPGEPIAECGDVNGHARRDRLMDEVIAIEQQRLADITLRDVAELPDQRILPARNPFHLFEEL
jgi:hypothetical protein